MSLLFRCFFAVFRSAAVAIYQVISVVCGHQGALLRRLEQQKAGGRLRLPASGAVAQVFVEPVERALPGLFGGGFVVARRGVVVEAVIGALVDMPFMGDAR